MALKLNMHCIFPGLELYFQDITDIFYLANKIIYCGKCMLATCRLCSLVTKQSFNSSFSAYSRKSLISLSIKILVQPHGYVTYKRECQSTPENLLIWVEINTWRVSGQRASRHLHLTGSAYGRRYFASWSYFLSFLFVCLFLQEEGWRCKHICNIKIKTTR